ncbi:hypothetical protein PENSPDRAFT_654973 [Peniophora sp. CONT]|nr:hypothetical protein PENSPDRAFT_654973 [Peniophora sp. CONT]
MSSQDPVNLLNDILNKRKSSHLLSWEFQQEGPGHDPVHIAIAKVSGVAVGQGTSKTRKDAKQIAATEAIRVLQASS